MSPLESALFGTDPWWITVIKVVVLFVILLMWTLFNVWFERRVLGRMQNRLGPIMNTAFIRGMGQAIGDGIKLIFKEVVTPKGADKIVFYLAPVISGIACFTSWAVIPLGGEVSMFGHQTRLQITDVPVAALFILSIAGIGIYGIVLAGWSSASTYSLLGSLRSSASMISYEVAMGLSLAAVFMFSGSMATSDIVAAQAHPLVFGGFNSHIPGHYWLLLLPSFVIYVITMFGESNRTPFDMSECEQELVSGYSTEYSGFPYGMYYLAEYINMATLSAVCTTLFLGGYGAPWPFNLIGVLDQGWFGLVWFFLKTQLVIFFFVWVRASIPRITYETLMGLGWKVLIPVSLVWVLLLAFWRTAGAQGWLASPVFVGAVVVIVLGLIAFIMFGGSQEEPPEPEPVVFDAFAGGYPVPPMPGQTLPDSYDIVHSETAEAAPAGAAAGPPGEDAGPTATPKGAN
ncbi:NADH-quinone oxidoreductase subunit NuoH [Acidipropionibacterium acidipropionici]|uniref:NADH-quinone oxidoreductase subunit NuoH n=1 Tax=Acidipropionibacterium acidipropionici TaxID=1748 RepID=UPI000409AEAD|nr:NADH-quinone oxidoreductase subunit NuoH [Acidipropionibacterium acidipropionici]ALN15365.1 NADH:ubiquinone oxidoreductase subunit H [Acidipropionibacterium acidipropionici]APZ08892.1 NADH-quinone oxidoreductase subunit H [Acidipropionibacterium acidipropionici]